MDKILLLDLSIYISNVFTKYHLSLRMHAKTLQLYITLFGVTRNWVFHGKQLTNHRLTDCILIIDTQILVINTNYGTMIPDSNDSTYYMWFFYSENYVRVAGVIIMVGYWLKTAQNLKWPIKSAIVWLFN